MNLQWDRPPEDSDPYRVARVRIDRIPGPRRALYWAALLMFTSSICVVSLQAQDQPFSSSSEYRSMLQELHQDQVRPSHMSTGTLLATAQPPSNLKVDQSAAALRLDTDLWRLEISKDRWGVALTNKQTQLTWRLAGLSFASDGVVGNQARAGASTLQLTKVESVERQGNVWRLQVEIAGSTAPASIEIEAISPKVIRLSIRSQHSEDNANMRLNFIAAGPYFGLGERFDRVKLDGLRSVLRPEDLLGKPGHNWTYIPVPFLFTPRGLGMYLDTAAVSTFDLSGADRGMFSIELEHSSVDAYFFIGEPKTILEDYTALTGRTPVPPPWTFGVWICSYQGPDQVLDDARRLRKEKIPSSAIWIFDVMGQGDIMGWPLWWTGYYPDPRNLTDQLHNLGFKVLTYVHPYLRSVLDPYNLPNPAFEEGVRTDLFILNSAGKPTGPGFEPFVDGNIDFTSTSNVDWWEQKIRGIVLRDNFDGWMEDFGEWVNDTDRFAAGVTGRKMANLNPLFYHRITYEIARKAKPDVVPFDRSGYAGSQGYTRVIWGGDQFPNWTQDYGLPSVVRAGITAGMSGFAVWGPDIAGNGYSTELWTRWVEFGALTPVMRNHLWNKPYGAVDLWHDPQTIDTFRLYAGLHVSLFPYFYTYAHEAAKNGLPIIRDLLLEFPNDPKTYDAGDEYMLGDKILVAPVLKQGASSRSLYLPGGSWVNFWTGQISQGNRQVTVPAPLEQIPILVRSGSIIPFISPETQTLAQDLPDHKLRELTNNLIWRVFPASVPSHDSFTLYDGTSAIARQDAAETSVQVENSPSVRRYEVVMTATNKPRKVTVSGESLSALNAEEYRDHKNGWRINANDRTLHVRFSGTNFKLSVAM